MNLGEALRRYLKDYAGLSALVSTRIGPATGQQGGTVPYVTYQRVSRPRVQTMGNDPGLTYPRYFVNCWDDSHDGAEDVAAQVINALKNQRNVTWGGGSGLTIQASIVDNDWEEYEPETKLWRVTVEAIIWHKE